MKFSEKLAAFMVGRYGPDKLSRFLSFLALIVLIINLFVRGIAGQILYLIVLLLLAFSLFRMLSRNTTARYKENVAYLKAKNRVIGLYTNCKRRLRERKTHRFYRCPTCKTTVRVPRGKGKIRITCPKCGNAFVRKS